ncbi:uncharacterized protein KY384_005525 [Bacidia gigantensis]|uniref:uncharacterized protein n=1 Tax=Bacidia gigantensis TaxID=2732470 RepID=UPI001D05BD96|nr:uncharacterized protein KY384_005525 [Bacidia gigantensis]KAG8530043.1 hypothetical protein KY384_005525 [Bacidia gigantensis]
MSSNSLEAKVCVLGAQGAGKTSLLHRYVKGTFNPPATASTIGASFLVKKVLDVESDTTVRLQLWDTAGQERFRAISRLYYRGASAILLVYSLIDEESFKEMGRWLREMKENVGEGAIIHVVGTKSDIVAQDPGARAVNFERCIAFVTENLYPEKFNEPVVGSASSGFRSLDGNSKRSSGFWGNEIGWDCCHEISSSSGEGIEEVFRVITRKLVEQKQKRLEADMAGQLNGTMDAGRKSSGNLDGNGMDRHGGFRVGYGDKRRSWLGLPAPNIGIGESSIDPSAQRSKTRRKGCC